jgi:CHAD domain-containing protein
MSAYHLLARAGALARPGPLLDPPPADPSSIRRSNLENLPVPSPLRFRIPGLMPTKAVTTALQERWNVVAEPVSTVRRTFLDTADWRVYRGGWTLEMDREPPATSTKEAPVVLRQAGSEAVLANTTCDGAPRFAGDLPDNSPWSEVAAAIGDRRLLDQVEMDSYLHRMSVRNDDEKTTAKVVIEWHRLVDQKGRQHLLRVATVSPVRGYERIAGRIGEALLDAGLEPQDGSLLPSALAALDRPQPGSKLGPGVPLEHSMAAAQAVGAILGRLRYHLLANEAGVREQLDIEFLHEYRVAIRRARSILRTVRGVLPPDDAQALAGELGWLGQLTGAPRDLDVHLAELRSANGDLAPLSQYLADRREAAQDELVAAMDSERYRRLLGSWAALERADADLAAAPDAARPVGEEADALIARAYRRVIRRGRAIEASTPPEALHDLRKRAKELRYLLECFQTLYPERERASVIKELKALQDNLGEFQDCQVQAEAVRTMAEELHRSGAPASTLMAMGRMAETLEERERRARLEFDARFGRFSRPANRQRMAELLSGDGASGGKKTEP